MSPYTQILRKYETAFRDLVTFKNWNSKQSVKDTLKLNKSGDWSFICTALDVIGDTTLAISNFLEYGLEGHKDGSDFGEMYLRLYGVLNASYLQQFAIVSLYKRCNLPKSGDVIERLRKLNIYKLRNKLGAHSNDYKNEQDILESYVITRISAKGCQFEYKNNESSEREWIDLKKYLEEHLKLIIDLMDKIYEKSIKTLYKGEKDKQEEQNKILLDLRKLKEGIIPN